MSCKEKGYEVGQVFEIIEDGSFSVGAIVILSHDDGSDCPKFDLVKGSCSCSLGVKTRAGAYVSLDNVRRLWPLEEKTAKVAIVCEGKEVEISRESAIALNLIKN